MKSRHHSLHGRGGPWAGHQRQVISGKGPKAGKKGEGKQGFPTGGARNKDHINGRVCENASRRGFLVDFQPAGRKQKKVSKLIPAELMRCFVAS